jgi:CHASE1-domain containing sensor protein
MDLQKTRRVFIGIGVILLVVSLPGMVFSRSPQRWGHFLAFGVGVLALLFAAFVVPLLQRRADAYRDE